MAVFRIEPQEPGVRPFFKGINIGLKSLCIFLAEDLSENFGVDGEEETVGGNVVENIIDVNNEEHRSQDTPLWYPT